MECRRGRCVQKSCPASWIFPWGVRSYKKHFQYSFLYGLLVKTDKNHVRPLYDALSGCLGQSVHVPLLSTPLQFLSTPRGFCPASHLSLTIAYAELVMTTLVVQWGLNQHGEHAIHAPFVDALFTSDWL